MKLLSLILGLLVLFTFIGGLYSHLSGKLLYRDRNLLIEVNGTQVDGDVLDYKFLAVVTRRDAGKNHSYVIAYAGDLDMEGNIGTVFDCQDWVAPRIWILPITAKTFRSCRIIPRQPNRCWGLCLAKEDAAQFSTSEGDTITLRRNSKKS